MVSDSLVAASCLVIARGLGFVKEMVVAAHYGLSGALDVYLLAFALIGLPASVLLNAIQPALISALASHDTPNGTRLVLVGTTGATLRWLTGLLAGWLIFVPAIFPIVASGFSPAKHSALQEALWWLTPWYFLNAINVLGYGVLQANRRYLQNGLIPIVTPIATIAVIVAAGTFDDWRPLAAALVGGTALETLCLVVTLRRAGVLASGRPDPSPDRARVMQRCLPLIPAALVLSMAPVVEQSIAAALGEGTNAAVSYGYKLPSALISVSATAIGITALPYFSRLLVQGRFGYCLHSLEKLGTWILVSGILVVMPLVLFSTEIVELLYARAAFDAAAVARVGPVQLAYLTQVPLAIISILAVRTLSALGRNGLVSLYTVSSLLVQGVLALVLGMRIGAAGIAWAASAGSALLAVLSFVTARSALRKLVL
jgi:putative peptidoglycan lipid II flippase